MNGFLWVAGGTIFTLSKNKNIRKLNETVMKKMIMAVVFIALTVGNTALAGTGGKGVDKRIKRAFEKEYAGAAEVKWYIYDQYNKIDFTFKDMHLMGFYNNDGEVLGVARNISFVSLPFMLQLAVKNNYSGYWIS